MVLHSPALTTGITSSLSTVWLITMFLDFLLQEPTAARQGLNRSALDAIEEFQINIAPYDVRQGGFTGGGINAVTKSGTNKFRGSIYYFGNNEKLVGKTEPINLEESPVADYQDYQAGFTIGGPIIRNKVFFFLNGEITRQITPLSAVPGTAGSNITIDEINRILAVIDRVAPSYDPGLTLI
ncbi:MAG: hypothetical protein MZV63_48330 [Marinilabiliales bacterium]|nr:hypothetical protein [Marinilabiliales bacterium]